MDVHYELNGLKVLWNAEKAKINISKHDGISFEQAETTLFDPFFRLVEPVVTMKLVMLYLVMTT
jgi:uncharacterized DUF497 family protein